METKISLILFLVMIFECNGHFPILGGIISATRERVHSTVDGVAGAVLGGISHGFNLNFGAHVGLSEQNHPQYVPQKEPGETIVVVVEEKSENEYGPQNANNYRPNHHDHRPYHQHQRPHTERPGFDDQYQRPHNGNEYMNPQSPGNEEIGNNNYGNNNQNFRPHGNNNDVYGDGNQSNQNNPQSPEEYPENTNQNTYNGGYSNHQTERPSTEYFKITESTEPSSTAKDATEKSSDDIPLFVPLNPDEYIYGGDNISITAPKRDTEKNMQTEADDEDFPIDARFKDQ